MEIDERSIADDLRAILACGPRAVGSPGERATADLVAKRFRDAGLRVEREPFRLSRWPLRMAGFVVPIAASLMLATLAIWFVDRPALWTLLLAVLSTVVLLLTRWSRLGAKLFDVGAQITSENIIARTGSFRAGRPTLLLMAHYDSKSQTLPLAPRLLAIVVCLAAVIALFVWTALESLGLLQPLPSVRRILIWIAVICLLMQAVTRSGNRSPGAVDNASGVAVLLALARVLPAGIGSEVTLCFVATGAEELGLGGALRFVQRHAARLSPTSTVCLNFESIGTGGTVLLVGARRPSSALSRRLRSCVEDQGLRARRLPFLAGVGMDHTPLEASGLPATSLTQDPWRTPFFIHGPGDRAEKIDPRELARIARAVCRFSGHIPRATERLDQLSRR